ncbi:myosin-1-like isoform X1 [Astatotilapia calliptera]|uniref:myosin-1-like isoform X1 n=2 Tax=Astatotilapia calliptera TaxID=8154 RepID=UPI000E40D7E4|nr:myosin-1-like isoform X1 [Astatotilapia calliptera]
MQQIYRHSNEHIEVYTTVFSPQVCRSRTRTRYVGAEKMAVARIQYRGRWPKELNLDQGDLVQVQFKEDEAWWFGRLKNGDEGYFPAACVELLQGGASSIATPTLLRRGSVPAVVLTAGAPCGCTSGRSTPKLLRKNSIRRPLGLGGPSVAAAGTGGSSAAPQGSPSLLHRVLAKSRRKSCPHLTHIHHPTPDTGSVNTAFQPD